MMRLGWVVVPLLFAACAKKDTSSSFPKVENKDPTPQKKEPAKERFADPKLVRKVIVCWAKPDGLGNFHDGPDGYPVGMYTGGVTGIIDYNNLTGCLSGERTQFGDHSAIARFAKRALHVKPVQPLPFKSFNPAIIQWGIDNLVPHPTTKITFENGHTISAQEFYDNVMQRFFRAMVISYLDISKADFDGHTKRYIGQALQSFPNHQGNGQNYLSSVFGVYHERQYREWTFGGGTPLTLDLAVGFWLRRHADDTDDLLWQGLQKVMRHYDAKWFAEEQKAEREKL